MASATLSNSPGPQARGRKRPAILRIAGRAHRNPIAAARGPGSRRSRLASSRVKVHVVLFVTLSTLLTLAVAAPFAWRIGGYGLDGLNGFQASRAPLACVRHPGATRRDCPTLRVAPKLLAYYKNVPLRPVLVGNTYTIDLGIWAATHHLRLSVEWLGGGDPAIRQSPPNVRLTPTDAQAGQVIAAWRAPATHSRAAASHWGFQAAS